MKKLLLISVLLCSIHSLSLLSASLYVIDPRVNGSPKQAAAIEDYKIIIKPQGLYNEYCLHFTISDSCPPSFKRYKPYDTLEIVMPFEMPKNAFFNDMYLKMDNGTWSRAILIDRWTARLIYETTVQRAWDPSLLLKNSQTVYELRVFPLAEGHVREVKINYFLPNNWSDGFVTSPLPLDFLKASSKPAKNVSIVVYPNSEFSDPAIEAYPELQFTDAASSGYKNALITYINYPYVDSVKNIKFQNKRDSKLPFAAMTKYKDRSYYQMRIPLDIDYSKIEGKKICFVLDHEVGKSTLSFQSVIDALKKNLREKLLPNDSINVVFFSDKACRSASDTWLSSDSIENAFSKVNFDPQTSISHLDTLLYFSVDLMNKNADSGLVVVVTNSDNFGTRDVGNKIIETIFDRLLNFVSFSTISYLNTNWKTNFIANIAYAGNDYMYFNLTRMTKGIMNKLVDNPDVYTQINNNLSSTLGIFENLNLNISAENGFLYNTYTDKIQSNAMQDIVATQTGILFGDLPLNIDLSYNFRKDIRFQRIKITEKELSPETYANKYIFGGRYVNNFEENNKDYNKISDIVQASMEFRILSIYTGLLCMDVDPQNTEDTSSTPNDVQNTISIDGIKLSVNPMPIVDNALIKISFDDKFVGSTFSLELFNSMGMIIKSIENGSVSGNEYHSTFIPVDNNGNKLMPGVYFLVLKLQGIRIVYKVLVE